MGHRLAIGLQMLPATGQRFDAASWQASVKRVSEAPEPLL